MGLLCAQSKLRTPTHQRPPTWAAFEFSIVHEPQENYLAIIISSNLETASLISVRKSEVTHSFSKIPAAAMRTVIVVLLIIHLYSVSGQEGACLTADCINGQCDSSQNCICYAGWTGPHCEIDINHCKTDASHFGPCDDRGAVKCIDGNSTYSCTCVIGFTGTNCEMDIDECLFIESPCSDHGTCTNDYFGRFDCECDIGFSGFRCEIDLMPCDPNPCLNHGTCLVLNSPVHTFIVSVQEGMMVPLAI